MNKRHKEILDQIKKHAGTIHTLTATDAYMGNAHERYMISVPVLRKVVMAWVKEHKNISAEELVELCTSLVEAPSETEKSLAGIILGYLSKQRAIIDPKYVDQWLDYLEGWGEVDSLCQNKFTHRDMLENWPAWKKLLEKLAVDQNINKRRASLVLLTGPTTYAIDQRLSDLAFTNIEKLKHEKSILITKAISWLLRSMIYPHRSEVEQYIRENAKTLPAIAVRETQRKLTTGKK